MKNLTFVNKILIVLPLILGVISLFTFGLYLYSANHAPYTYTDIILAGPVFSFIGVIISFITRKNRKIHPALWTYGLITCLFGFMVCILIIIILILFIAATFRGAI